MYLFCVVIINFVISQSLVVNHHVDNRQHRVNFIKLDHIHRIV